MIGGRPSFRVDAHSGAISEVILSFCVTFLVLLIILRGPRKLLAKTFLLAIATVSVFIAGSTFTRPFMNPAIAFGWAYIHKSHNTWNHFYVYWFSSFTGAILSAILFRSLFPPPLPALGAAAGAITIMEMIPEKYKTMIGGRPSFRVDAHSGAISEVILSFCVTFLVLLIILRGPRKLLAKTFLLAIATVSVFIAGSTFTRPFMNPAIAFGWAYIHKSHNTWNHFYVYWFSSFTGAILSAILFRSLFPPPLPVQKKQKKA
ncbi:hypothetical protein F2Q69_00044594 [Brassica cretica]|uniref:Aquaporin n=1 Tax=Brassica cretica TaxID=69181 RepID=A0A8S9NL58_BRACR|nr:hypothetical protein F2Q69_00044594 [Brassica cretica]